MFFDSHCHLSSEALAADLPAVLARARDAGVTRLLNIADSLPNAQLALAQARAAQTQTLAHAATDEAPRLWATAGVHPQQALQWDATSAATLAALAADSLIVAIGEIGLDFVYDEQHPQYPGATRAEQEIVFRAQLRIACDLGLPVVIHNREADEALLSVVADYPGLRGVFHCFASDQATARRALELGFYLGFTGLLTFKNAASVREVAAACPPDRLLLETDAPYLAPVPHRGKSNEPAYLAQVAPTLAALHSLSVSEIGAITTANACALFGLD